MRLILVAISCFILVACSVTKQANINEAPDADLSLNVPLNNPKEKLTKFRTPEELTKEEMQEFAAPVVNASICVAAAMQKSGYEPATIEEAKELSKLYLPQCTHFLQSMDEIGQRLRIAYYPEIKKSLAKDIPTYATKIYIEQKYKKKDK